MYQRDTSIPVFIAINFMLGGLAGLWSIPILCVMIFGILFSGDPPDEIMAGVLGSVMLGVPGVVACIVYLAAGVGMVKRQRWGYYVHLVGACLAALSCIGIAYTIPALIIAQRPTFRGEFFPEHYPEMPLGFSPLMPNQQPFPPQQQPRR